MQEPLVVKSVQIICHYFQKFTITGTRGTIIIITHITERADMYSFCSVGYENFSNV